MFLLIFSNFNMMINVFVIHFMILVITGKNI